MVPPTGAGGRMDERYGNGGGPERGGSSGGGQRRSLVRPAAELMRPATKGGDDVLPSATPVFGTGHKKKLESRPGRKLQDRVRTARSNSPPCFCPRAFFYPSESPT